MNANAALFEFMIGEWSVEVRRLPEGAKVGRHAIVRAAWFLDSTAILDEWRHIDESGTVNFRGATFRTYLSDKDLWYVLWMPPSVAGFSEIYARRAANEVRTSGKGRDPLGEFLERGTYSQVSDDAFSFALERSYENGLSFIPFVSFRAARATRSRPPEGQQA